MSRFTSLGQITEEAALTLIKERLGGDSAQACQEYREAANAGALEVFAVLWNFKSKYPVTKNHQAMPRESWAEELVEFEGGKIRLMEKWSDGRIEPGRWHEREVRNADLDRLWPETPTGTGEDTANPDVEVISTATNRSAVETCKDWIRRQDRPKNKVTMRAEAIAAIDGLTRHGFDHAWLEVAPAAWRKSGRPRKKPLKL
jgi:hypothetical protein